VYKWWVNCHLKTFPENIQCIKFKKIWESPSTSILIIMAVWLHQQQNAIVSRQLRQPKISSYSLIYWTFIRGILDQCAVDDVTTQQVGDSWMQRTGHRTANQNTVLQSGDQKRPANEILQFSPVDLTNERPLITAACLYWACTTACTLYTQPPASSTRHSTYPLLCLWADTAEATCWKNWQSSEFEDNKTK